MKILNYASLQNVYVLCLCSIILSISEKTSWIEAQFHLYIVDNLVMVKVGRIDNIAEDIHDMLGLVHISPRIKLCSLSKLELIFSFIQYTGITNV